MSPPHVFPAGCAPFLPRQPARLGSSAQQFLCAASCFSPIFLCLPVLLTPPLLPCGSPMGHRPHPSQVSLRAADPRGCPCPSVSNPWAIAPQGCCCPGVGQSPRGVPLVVWVAPGPWSLRSFHRHKGHLGQHAAPSVQGTLQPPVAKTCQFAPDTDAYSSAL